MFLGEFRQAIDIDGRLVLPSHYLSAFPSEMIVTRGFDRNLMLLANEQWQQLAHKILNQPQSNQQIRNLRRRVFSNAAVLNMDQDGRILVPGPLRDFAELEGGVIVVGMYDYLEIWNSQRWLEVCKAMGEENNGSVLEVVGV